jgi:hypothetical protein
VLKDVWGFLEMTTTDTVQFTDILENCKIISFLKKLGMLVEVEHLAPKDILANLAKLEVEIQQGMEKLETLLK